ncbi:MAG: triose-phosphate isomerase [Candidatus Lokiarchaeota archaeon]|nr:triose-phosphate isomerase [Candidatus Lokiarchaeota archaeon]MBD3339287.1 triose-phosphate isomerase [Candidatus Lokiarchaeota archaeon]
MERKFVVGGNWKMHRGTPSDAKMMLKKFLKLVKKIENVDIIIAPPFTAIPFTTEYVKKSKVKIGAQNMYFEKKGAYTGEISPVFLKEIGCEYTILGHSERRHIFNETDELINKKLKLALNMNLKPIVCIGELLEEREAGQTNEIIEKQFKGSFRDLKEEEITNIIIAYEPVWAIGTGKTATPEQAEEVHQHVRDLIKKTYSESVSKQIRIQYGGSIKPHNAEELFKQKNIDGGLVGGASLEAESFSEIIKSAEMLSK